jgi:hypothetical protein
MFFAFFVFKIKDLRKYQSLFLRKKKKETTNRMNYERLMRDNTLLICLITFNGNSLNNAYETRFIDWC